MKIRALKKELRLKQRRAGMRNPNPDSAEAPAEMGVGRSDSVHAK
jgi:hypothetical protein